MDADGVLNGRIVDEGEKIGVVSNYLDHPNGTTRHLHFDVQVFTRDGWLWVNPYVTLISAYERLIRGRGREIGPESRHRRRWRMRCRRMRFVRTSRNEGASINSAMSCRAREREPDFQHQGWIGLPLALRAPEQ